MLSLKEILSKFDLDTCKGFSLYDVGISLPEISEAEKGQKPYLYESIAFMLMPTPVDNPWESHYYGPMCTMRGVKGEPIYKPAQTEITTEAIQYWYERSNETNNPLMKMHYLGLVWDFQQSVTGQKNTGELYNAYVESILTVCNEDYCSHPTETVTALERLFELASTNTHYLPLTKQAYRDFEKRHAADDAPRLWGSLFTIMLHHKKNFSDDERKTFVEEHEQRLLRLSTQEIEGKINPWFAKDEAELLAEYYKGQQSIEDIKRVFNIVEAAFGRAKGDMSKFQYAANVEQIVTLYRHYGLEDEATRLTAVIQRLFAESKDEMESFQTPFEIPQEAYEQADLMFGDKASSDDERWNNFAFYFIPRKKEEEESLIERGKKFFFMNMTGNQLLDPKGRPLSKIGTLEQDFDGNLALHTAHKMNFQQYSLAIAINRLLSSGALTTEKVMQRIKLSPIFEEDRYAIIAVALNYFINGEYVLFSHLIVPQIETAIRNLVDMSGEPVIKLQRGGENDKRKGYQYKTLDELLRQPSIEYVFSEDGAYYLRLVLTDQRALNIRNNLCHGILSPEYFDTRSAGRLLHVLIMLSLIRLQK